MIRLGQAARAGEERLYDEGSPGISGWPFGTW